MKCYHCGKKIVRAEEGIALGNLNWAHYECIVSDVNHNMDNEEWVLPKAPAVFNEKPVSMSAAL